MLFDGTLNQKELGFIPRYDLKMCGKRRSGECRNPVFYTIIKRSLDLFAAVSLLLVLIVPMIIIALLVKATSEGPFLFWSDRVGADNKIFKMPKFRSMRINTPVVATHLLSKPEEYQTPIGPFLRKLSLDELPQLWSVLRGSMSFVGPRPALHNQDDLVELRTKAGIHKLIPGVTGWAQVNGRDELSIPVKVKYDEYYLKNRSFILDLKIIFITILKVLGKQGVSH